MNLPRSADFSPQEATPAKRRPCGLKPALLNGSWPRSRSGRRHSPPPPTSLRPLLAGLLVGLFTASCATGGPADAPASAPAPTPAPPTLATSAAPAVVPERHVLLDFQHWWLELPGNQRFDASGLSLTPAGELLVISDRGPQVYRIELPAEGDSARLAAAPANLAAASPAIRKLAPSARLDCEGLAFDNHGNLYLCEESRRTVFRVPLSGGPVERLAFDWTPVGSRFSKTELNASFEGIAVGGGSLFLANEREQAAIVEVDLASREVRGAFVVRPERLGFGPLHYSDLSWHNGRLFVLARHQRTILEVDPKRRAVVAEYDFEKIENAPEIRYRRRYPTGVMEGLAVDDQAFWLVSDNNGEPRAAAPQDRRPVLLRIPRPARP